MNSELDYYAKQKRTVLVMSSPGVVESQSDSVNAALRLALPTMTWTQLARGTRTMIDKR